MKELWIKRIYAARHVGLPVFLSEITFYYFDYFRSPIWRYFRTYTILKTGLVPKFNAIRWDTVYYLPGLIIFIWSYFWIYFWPLPEGSVFRTFLIIFVIWRIIGLFVSHTNAWIFEPYRDFLLIEAYKNQSTEKKLFKFLEYLTFKIYGKPITYEKTFKFHFREKIVVTAGFAFLENLFLFGALYYLVWPEWSTSSESSLLLGSSWDGLYFSVIIGTTLGITGAPAHFGAKLALISGVLIGLFYAAVLIARGVSLMGQPEYLFSKESKSSPKSETMVNANNEDIKNNKGA